MAQMQTVFISLSSHLSLNREGRWGTTDDFATSFLHFPLLSTHDSLSESTTKKLPLTPPPKKKKNVKNLQDLQQAAVMLYHFHLHLRLLRTPQGSHH